MYQHLARVWLVMAMIGLFASATEAFGNNRFCKTSDYKQICNLMVKDANNWHDATRNAIQSSIDVAVTLQKMTPTLDKALGRLSGNSKDSTTSTCKETFDNTVDDLKQCLKFLDNNDTASLNIHLSAATSVTDCQDAFQESGAELPPRVAKITEELSKYVSNCLAVSEQT